MKNWLKSDKHVKKKNNKNPYLTVENGKVVPVVEGKEENKEPNEEKNKEVRPPNPDEVEATPQSKFKMWILLIVAVLLAFYTFKLYSDIAVETKEELVLQEIQRNTVEVKKDKAEDLPTTNEDIIEKANNWKDDLKSSFQTEPKASDEPIQPVDESILFDIRSEDEEGTVLLQQIRDMSVKHINGELSRGQYILHLQSIDLKMNRYHGRIESLDAKITSSHAYQEYIDYVTLKEEGIQSLLIELRVSQADGIAVTFNNAVDFHNELSVESDKLFTSELKKLGYTVTVENGTIKYK